MILAELDAMVDEQRATGTYPSPIVVSREDRRRLTRAASGLAPDAELCGRQLATYDGCPIVVED